MTKPHKFEVNRLSQDHLHILNFYFRQEMVKVEK
jgi:hypothetical protein